MNDGSAEIAPTQAYGLFMRAETLGMTVAKLVTGKDMPLGNMEVVLSNTFAMVRQRLEKRRDKRKGKS